MTIRLYPAVVIRAAPEIDMDFILVGIISSSWFSCGGRVIILIRHGVEGEQKFGRLTELASAISLDANCARRR